ncbi:sigma-54 interaction domain-containing protein [Candidatus Nitronereus thalassa]|uniref:Sigma 54-interacting transcriptional regulator n=1 Tax=Candidatus Nitronereus thalassa TaxID=3020898 RepID=A0ABU3K4Z1_9BACT|nr:sigma 54-interacting transcriptional regulator [Candidatus Nitronereus thalassa]MDT7041423.1 sigma 54-interacting transcriptional regulator [Candidatus Nitronereus thalassa]
MKSDQPLPIHDLDEEAALHTILEGTATETGERFFQALVQNLSKALGTHGAWVTEYFPETRRLKALAFWMGGEWIHGYETPIDGTPCGEAIDSKELVHFPDNILSIYPDEVDLIKAKAVSYLGAPLLDVDGTVLGHVAVLDRRPIPDEPRVHALFRIFAARAAAELQRLQAETQVREREEKLGRLVDSAMDAIIELNSTLCVTRVNPAAEKVFLCKMTDMQGQPFFKFLSIGDRARVKTLIEELDAHPVDQQYLWIPGGLTALRTDGNEFPAEATLSRFQVHRQTFHTLILRNVHDRLEAEQKIRTLTEEAEYLKKELQELQHFDSIVGESEALLRTLRDIRQVAETEATVLIQGETGTGKEVMARAIHAASRRKDKPFVKVNCAAIPATLIESEFFGHEPGAFTGATKKRDGRFTLADGGTIFLDEIGELPLDLQSKLLRVLQEGEFDPVGSSQTRKVNVRVLAATNRDLEKEAKAGTFREDLYYRLNVFPITVPPLRERGKDIGLLASNFATKFAKQMGRSIQPLSADCVQRLQAYSWPGNVRELQNVIERAVITSINGQLNLERALPEQKKDTGIQGGTTVALSNDRIHTVQELQEIERQNILRALKVTDGRVSGENGAAKLLGMNQSTLASRMKTLGIQRPS